MRKAGFLVVPAAMVVMASAMLLAPGCSKDASANGKAQGKGGAGKATPVSAVKAVMQDFPIEIATFGNVEASTTVSIQPQVTGVVNKVNFSKGQYLKKGQLLFEIDPRPLQASLKQTEANMARDKAAAESAKQDLNRVGELLTKKIASQDEYDKAKAAADGLDAAVAAGEAAVDNMKLQLEHCYINCPIDGRAGNIPVDAGNVVQADVTKMVTINQVRPIEVKFSISQDDLWAVRQQAALGQGAMKAVVTIPGDDAVEEGELTFIDNTVDKSTGMVEVSATLPNDDERLWPGQYVNVKLTLSVHKDAIVVPMEAIQNGRDGQYVYVLIPAKGDKGAADAKGLVADYRSVTVGPRFAGRAVLEKGVAAGEMVVTDGQLSLLPGNPAVIKELSTTRGASKPSGTGSMFSLPSGK